jgi:sucrose phosphorylase
MTDGPAAPPAAQKDSRPRVHLPGPDYALPRLEVEPSREARLRGLLSRIYGPEIAAACYPELVRMMRVYWAHKPEWARAEDREFEGSRRFDETDVVLITYGDLLASRGRRPLEALEDFVSRFLQGAITTVHLLPFFPYSSDRGFAVIDFEQVDPRLGTWEDIERLGQRFRLMFDGVFNHVSAKSRWFQRFQNGRPGYESYFVSFDDPEAITKEDLGLILRPRTSDLLTPFQTLEGTRWVWTTFGPDQVDLNFRNPEVLLRVVEVLLLYVRRGADVIRLDAVTYLWRQLGTRCAHLAETHSLVQLFRAVLDVVAPRVALITETNVPHADNVAYFGDGRNEAQLVYNFALPPLMLHTFLTGDCGKLGDWAEGLTTPSPETTFFNFLDSHDGIGLLGASELLTPAEILSMVRHVESHGGLVSHRRDGDRSSPYELNVTWYSALNPDGPQGDDELQVARFVASRAIALALAGVPGVYLPGFFGAKNDLDSVRSGAEARAINRVSFDVAALEAMLNDPSSWMSRVSSRFGRLIRVRTHHPAFHPQARQIVHRFHPNVFALSRVAVDGGRVLTLTNVSDHRQTFKATRTAVDHFTTTWIDLMDGSSLESRTGDHDIALEPYAVKWLVPG